MVRRSLGLPRRPSGAVEGHFPGHNAGPRKTADSAGRVQVFHRGALRKSVLGDRTPPPPKAPGHRLQHLSTSWRRAQCHPTGRAEERRRPSLRDFHVWRNAPEFQKCQISVPRRPAIVITSFVLARRAIWTNFRPKPCKETPLRKELGLERPRSRDFTGRHTLHNFGPACSAPRT